MDKSSPIGLAQAPNVPGGSLTDLATSPQEYLQQCSETDLEQKLADVLSQLRKIKDEAVLAKIGSVCETEMARIGTSNASPLQFYIAVYLNLQLLHPGSTDSAVLALLPLLSVEDTKTYGMVMVALMSLAKKDDSFGASIVNYLNRILSGNPLEMLRGDYLVLFNTLETFFPLFPSLMKSVYTSNECKQAFLYQVYLLNPEKHAEDVLVAEKILRVIALACIDELARKFNTETYLTFLISGTKVEASDTIVALSLLCIVKLWSFSSIEKQISLETVFGKVLQLFRGAEAKSSTIEPLLECLAYLSLGASSKTALRADEDVINQLVLILETSKEASTIYGALLVISNLSKGKDPSADKDTTTVNYLKKMAVPKGSPEKENDDEDISLFNQALVADYKMVGTITGLKLAKDSSLAQAVAIIYNVCLNQPNNVQREIVAQGGLNFIIQYLVGHSQVRKGTLGTCAQSVSEGEIQTRLIALRALAIICRSVNPSNLFLKYDVKTCIPFLVELLGTSVDELAAAFDSSERAKDPAFALHANLGILDKFYALLALTNICSLQDSELHRLVVNRSFDQHLSSLMIDSTIPDIQKATWELINNLILEPTTAAKFFNTENKESKKNLSLLVNLLHSQDEALQVVIAGLLASSTMEYPFVTESIMKDNTLLQRILGIVAAIFSNQTENNALVLRVAAILLSIVEVAESSMPSVLTELQKNSELKSGIKKVVVTTKDGEIMDMLRETIQKAKLKF